MSEVDFAARAVVVNVTPTFKITQDFVSRDGLSACRKLRPFVSPTDGSVQVYCLTDAPGVGTPVRLWRSPGQAGWLQESLSSTPGADILVMAPGGTDARVLQVPYATSRGQFPPPSAVLGFAAALNAEGGPGSFETWPQSWTLQSIAQPLWAGDLVVPFPSAPFVLAGERRDTGAVPFFVEIQDGADVGVINLGNLPSIDAAEGANPIQALPFTAGEISFLNLTTTGQFEQWTGSPDTTLGPLESAEQPPQPVTGSITVFSVAASPEAQALQDGGVIIVVALTGGSGWSSIVGRIDTNRPGLIAWDDSWSFVSPRDAGGNPIVFDQLAAIIDGSGICSLFLRDKALQLNLTGLDLTRFSDWSDLLVLATGVEEIAPFIDASGRAAYAVVGAGGLVVSQRQTLSTDWYNDRVVLDVDTVTPPSSVYVYRCGVTLTDGNNVGLADVEVTVETSTNVSTMIQGKSYATAPGRVITTRTDGSGSVWVTATVDPTILAAPAVTFRSSALNGGQLEIRPDQAVADFMGSVTADQLQNGSDPQQVPVVPPAYQDQAQAVADALHQIHQMASPLYARGSIAVANVNLKPQAGVSLRPLSPIGVWPSIAPMGGGAWGFSTRSGKAVFRTLDAAEIAKLSSRPVAACTADVRGLFGVDWGDVWDSVVDGITEVVDVVVHDLGDQVTAMVTFVINGVELVISTVLDAASQAFDLVTGVFSQIGTLLGTVTGWLVKMIGYLFGWKEILDRRDALLTQIQGLPAMLVGKFPDPSGFIDQTRAFVHTLKTDFQSIAGSVTGAGDDQFGVPMASWPAMPDALGDVLSPVSWLMEKLSGATGNIGAFTPTVSPAISVAWSNLEGALGKGPLTTALQTLVNDVAGAWMTSSAALASGRPSDLLAPLTSVISGLADALLNALDAFQALVEAVWTSEGLSSFVDSLNQAVSIPFLSGFYKGLTNNDLSILDVICLAGAIIDDTGTSALSSTAPASIAQTLLWVGIGTRALSAGTFSFGLSSTSISFFDVIDTGLCFTVSMLMLLAITAADLWMVATILYLMWAAGALTLKLLRQDDTAAVLTLVLGLIGILTSLAMFAESQALEPTLFTLFDGIALFISAVASFFVESGKEMPGFPASAIAYTVLQTGLATGCAVTYKLSTLDRSSRTDQSRLAPA